MRYREANPIVSKALIDFERRRQGTGQTKFLLVPSFTTCSTVAVASMIPVNIGHKTAEKIFNKLRAVQ